MTYKHLSKEERDEIFEDRWEAFELGIISEKEFKCVLGKLGRNATEIEEILRSFRPGVDDGESEGDTN